MPRTYTNLLTHIVFSTKNRTADLKPELRPKVHGYLWGIVKNCGCTPVAINGTDDHVHLLVGLRPELCVADFVRTLKANSSKWIHEEHGRPRFAWQLGYAGVSVSRSNREAVARYIAGQEQHHHKMTFQEEFVALLKRHGIEFDERFLWG